MMGVDDSMVTIDPCPLVSIVTVTLNCAQDALSTAESVRAQKFTAFEYIVKDGGSTDGTVEKLVDLDFGKIVSCPDKGIYDAMNQALNVCSGKYVLFLNAGDLLVDDTILETLSAYCLSNRSPEVIYFDFIDGTFEIRISNPARLSEFYMFRRGLCHQACLVRLDSYKRVGGFDTKLAIGADYDVLTRIIVQEHGYAKHVPLTAIYYRGAGFSAALTNRKLARANRKLIHQKYYSPFKRHVYQMLMMPILLEFYIQFLVSRHQSWNMLQKFRVLFSLYFDQSDKA